MKRTITYTITEYDELTSIDRFLRAKGYSSANITALKKMDQNVVLNGEWVHMKHALVPGDILMVNITEDNSSEKIPPTQIDLDIVYEDDDIVVINKPAGLPIHPSLNHYEYSLANGLAYYYEVQQNVPFIFRCCNRLDKNTSGLTVISKHLVSANILSTMVKNRQFHRQYLAIVKGSLVDQSGTIDAPIARVSDSIITRCVDFENGERAVTHYQVIKEENNHSLLKIHLETGRTHQIRVHFKHIGHPLIGDYLYNPDMDLIARQALHSYEISFNHPITGVPLKFTCPPPEDMQHVIRFD